MKQFSLPLPPPSPLSILLGYLTIFWFSLILLGGERHSKITSALSPSGVLLVHVDEVERVMTEIYHWGSIRDQ